MQLLPKRRLSFRAGIAGFLLTLRLKARRRAGRSSDIVERAVHIIFVTCKNWFVDFNTPPASSTDDRRITSTGAQRSAGTSTSRCKPL